jgi:hypothetical protein
MLSVAGLDHFFSFSQFLKVENPFSGFGSKMGFYPIPFDHLAARAPPSIEKLTFMYNMCFKNTLNAQNLPFQILT